MTAVFLSHRLGDLYKMAIDRRYARINKKLVTKHLLQILHTKLSTTDQDKLSYLLPIFETIFKSTEVTANFLGISQSVAKNLSPSIISKLNQILTTLFQTSPRMFLGTLDYLYETDYLDRYLSAEITDAHIHFLSLDFLKDTICFEVFVADMIIQIQDAIYQIKFQTRPKYMAIHIAKYPLQAAITKLTFNSIEGAYAYELPVQAYIYLEESPYIVSAMQNLYKSNLTTNVKELLFWQCSISQIFEYKMYNLLPLMIFQFRVKLLNSSLETPDLRKSFVSQVNQILEQFPQLANEVSDKDMAIAKLSLYQLIEYFDYVYFDNTISKCDELDAAFNTATADNVAN